MIIVAKDVAARMRCRLRRGRVAMDATCSPGISSISHVAAVSPLSKRARAGEGRPVKIACLHVACHASSRAYGWRVQRPAEDLEPFRL